LADLFQFKAMARRAGAMFFV